MGRVSGIQGISRGYTLEFIGLGTVRRVCAYKSVEERGMCVVVLVS